jgi:hypothetical protein
MPMDDILARFWSDLAGRVHGPFSFRFVLQPAMAVLFAARDGLADARSGRPAYFWSLLTSPGNRAALLRDGMSAVARVVGLGVVMDLLYQLIVLHRIYPVELLVIVGTLAFVPYLLLRGPVNRIARLRLTDRVRTP